MDLEKLRVFYIVSMEGSVLRASYKLNIAQSAVSRTISLLEESLKSKLFIRKHQGMVLTDTGKILLDKTLDILKLSREAEQMIEDFNKKPRGNLLVYSTAGLINHWIMKFVPGFLEAYPDISLILHGTSNLTLENNEADVCIGYLPEEEASDLETVYLTTLVHRLYASKKYIDKFGKPKSFDDLKNHRLLAYSLSNPSALKNADWLFEKLKRHKPYLQINSADGLIRAVKDGLGIATLGENVIQSDKDGLVEILPEYGGQEINLYYYYRPHMKYSKRVSSLADYILENLPTKK